MSKSKTGIEVGATISQNALLYLLGRYKNRVTVLFRKSYNIQIVEMKHRSQENLGRGLAWF